MSIRFAIAGSILFVAEIVILLSYAAAPDAVAAVGQPNEPAQQAQASRNAQSIQQTQVSPDAQSAEPIQLAQAAARTDGDVLAQCMNGLPIALDEGEVMTCHIRRMKR